jgi:nucleoside 2-deoxyribosyltransferase
MTGLVVKDAKSWRDYVTSKLPDNVKTLSPLRGQVEDDNEVIDSVHSRSLFCNQRAITARDRYDCLRSDVVLANVLEAKKVSIGTCVELGWCNGKNIPIVLVMEKGNIHTHPILVEMADFVVNNLDTAIKVVRSILDV